MTFVLDDEDHTMGNAIRYVLMRRLAASRYFRARVVPCVYTRVVVVGVLRCCCASTLSVLFWAFAGVCSSCTCNLFVF